MSRRCKRALRIESTESIEGCILSEEMASPLEFSRETLKNLKGLEVDNREQRQEARKVCICSQKLFGYKKLERDNISSTIDKGGRKKVAIPQSMQKPFARSFSPKFNSKSDFVTTKEDIKRVNGLQAK